MLVKINDRDYDSQILKYSGITSNLKDSIFKNYLWFSDPADFNDPYCKGKGHTPESLADYFIDNPTYLRNTIQQYANSVASTIGVSCFSQEEDNLLMWSHYADKHKGLCLKFDM